MSVEAMIVLNLHTTDHKKRALFYESLEDSGWEKLPSVDTLWLCPLSEILSNKGAEKIVKAALNNASAVSRVDYSSWYFIGKDDDVLRGHDGTGIYKYLSIDTILGSGFD